MTTEPEQATPLEDRANWNRHRATFDAALAAGCHWECSQELAFLAVEAFTGEPGKYMASPCAKCARLFEDAKQREGKAAT
jgi:hypothetical protein